jgi:hypothetical protein
MRRLNLNGLITLTACASFACGGGSDGTEAREPLSENAPTTNQATPQVEAPNSDDQQNVATPTETDIQYLGRAIYAFTDEEDTTPSEVVVASSTGYAECSLLFPGNTPMTGATHSVECTVTGPGLLVEAFYPANQLPPRTADSRTEPPPRPDVDSECSGGACSTSGTNWDPSPDFPHVAFLVRSTTDEDEVTLSVDGNNHQLEMVIPLVTDTWDGGLYVDLDAAE